MGNNFRKENLPQGWIITKINQVCDILDSKRIPINSTERNSRNIGKSSSMLFPYYGATGEVGKIDDYIFEGEHLLLGEDGAPFLDPFKNKAYLATGKFWVNNHAHILQAGASNKFICYYLNQLSFANYVTGTTRLKLNQAVLKEIPVLFPPLPEQHRIVAKIEALFSELDKGIESLKTAREQLKNYRQALLKHAFSGKLTAQWRADRSEKRDNIPLRDVIPDDETAAALLQRIQTEREQRYQQQLKDWEANGKQGSKPKPPKTLPPLTAEELADLPELPEGWAWVKLAYISDVSGGLTKNSKRNDLTIKRPFLRVGNVYANKLVLDEMHLIGISKSEIDRVALLKNDILIVEGNGSADQIGRAAIWNGAIEGCVHQNHLIKARPLKIVSSEFILFFLMSEIGRKFIVRVASSTSGLHTLNISKIENLAIPFCDVDEQIVLIKELAEKFSLVDQLDQTLSTALQQAETLRQSILKKAFSGQLVPQDPNDEPASVLLERIQAEKKQLEAQTPRRRGKNSD